MDTKQSQAEPILRSVCSVCQKPIADRAEGNVTRYLSQESRCCCQEPALALAERGRHTEQAVDPQEKSQIESNLGDRYEVISLLGRGGMGAVYKVKDKQLNQLFAIKVLNRQLVEDKGSLKRFEQEATAASSLTHVNLAAVYDYGTGKTGSPFIVMDYLPGENLADILAAEGYLDVPRAVDIFIQVTEAVAYAHEKGVIHRDIKPGNIIIEPKEDGVELVKLVDFGIAKVLPSSSMTAQMTQTGEVLGSPTYMSPEQCLGNKLDGRSDIYELGCVMYEGLTGIAPFAAENSIKSLFKHVNDDATPISELKQDFAVPAALELIVLHCLERDPESRYQSAKDLLADLLSWRDGKPISVKPKPKPQPKLMPPSAVLISASPLRRTWLPVLFFAIIVTSTIGTRMFWPHYQRSPRHSPRAITASDDAQSLDQMSYKYFMRGEYDKAIPLLEFGIRAYKEKETKLGKVVEDNFLADNLQHVGKCYLELSRRHSREFKDAAEKAVPYYQEAIRIYNKVGKYPGSLMREAVTDYASVLSLLGRRSDADTMVSEFNRTGEVGSIP